jgi:uncharacterized membrane protein YbhN (UPF0104 family)
VTHWSPGRVVRLLVATSLTALVLWKANPAAAVRIAARADFRWIAAAILSVVADRALMAYRWLVLLCPIDADQRPPFGAVMRVFFVSTFLGNLPPRQRRRRHRPGLRPGAVARAQRAAVASVLMDRLLGVLSIVVVGVAGVLLAPAGSLASTRPSCCPFTVASRVWSCGALVVFSERVALMRIRS